MDLPPQPPPTTATAKARGKLPAPHLTNGALKRQKQPPPVPTSYGKCMKNHAASTGGQVVDGCTEYLPAPAPTCLDCDACGCHRNFHNPKYDHSNQPNPQVIECQCCHYHHHHHRPPTPPPSFLATMGKSSSTPESQSPPPISSSCYPAPPHMFLTLNPGLPPPEPANNHHPAIITTAVATGSNPNGKKRFRSKFTEHQKERMQEFAVKIGWKMLKTEEEMIAGFCNEIGVTKTVFKVWMHNHKGISNSGKNNDNHQNYREHSGNVIGANGSSSSS